MFISYLLKADSIFFYSFFPVTLLFKYCHCSVLWTDYSHSHDKPVSFPVKELSFISHAFFLYPPFSTKACNKSSVGICVAFILFTVNFKLKCSIFNLCLSCRFVCYLLLFFHLVCWIRSGEFGIRWLLLPYYEMVLNFTLFLI